MSDTYIIIADSFIVNKDLEHFHGFEKKLSYFIKYTFNQKSVLEKSSYIFIKRTNILISGKINDPK